MSRAAKLVTPLVFWTVFVWVVRIPNIWTDDGLDIGGQALRMFFAVVFLLFAITMAYRLLILRGNLRRGDQRVLFLFISWTFGFWLIRGIKIIFDDHAASFKIVHAGLMAVSIGVGFVASKALSMRSISLSPPMLK